MHHEVDCNCQTTKKFSKYKFALHFCFEFDMEGQVCTQNVSKLVVGDSLCNLHFPLLLGGEHPKVPDL